MPVHSGKNDSLQDNVLSSEKVRECLGENVELSVHKNKLSSVSIRVLQGGMAFGNGIETNQTYQRKE